VSAYLDWLGAHPNLYRFVRARTSRTPSSPLRRVKSGVADRVATIIREYMVAAGGATSDVADTLATGIVGLVDAAINRWLDDPEGVDRETLTSSLTAMVQGAADAVLAPAPL
jgi:hypothetical protein